VLCCESERKERGASRERKERRKTGEEEDGGSGRNEGEKWREKKERKTHPGCSATAAS
jgi:hypothetical protein